MGSRKSKSKKKRLVAANNSAKSAPRWVDLRKYGLKRSLTRNVKPRRSRHWRSGDTDE